MSAAALAATLAVAFVGGGLGAIVGPLITGRQRRAERQAGRREEPYRRLLVDAQKLVSLAVTHMCSPADLDDHQKWIATAQEYQAAQATAEDVNSPQMRTLAEDFLREVALLVGANYDVATAGTSSETARKAGDAVTTRRVRVESAYERLRDQVQRETSG